MPVEYVVDSLDTVDESIRGAYVENEGKFNFDPDKYAEIKIQSSGLKKKNSDLIAANKQIKEAAKRFEKFQELEDDDLEELLELREQKKNPPPPQDGKPKDGDALQLQANFDKALKKATDKHTTEKAELETKVKDLDLRLQHYELITPVTEAALKAGMFQTDIKLMLKDVAGRIVLNEQRKPVVLDEDGDPTDITLARFFESNYKEEQPKFYPASGASGSGAPSTTASRGGKKTIKRSEFDGLDQAARMAKIKDGYKVED